MTNRLAAIDAALVVVIALIVLIVSPGVAVTGIVALVVLVGCGISFAIERLRRGSRSQRVRTVKKSRL